METRFNERMRDIDASHAQNMDEMKKKVNELRILSERERKRHAAELADLMQAHEDRLTNLNSEVYLSTCFIETHCDFIHRSNEILLVRTKSSIH